MAMLPCLEVSIHGRSYNACPLKFVFQSAVSFSADLALSAPQC